MLGMEIGILVAWIGDQAPLSFISRDFAIIANSQPDNNLT